MIVGAVLSMLTLTAAVLAFPATSRAWPGTLWFWPSELITVVEGQLATPDRPSLQLYVTVTSVLFQPAPLDGGAVAAVTMGGVLSILSVVLTVETLPAWSTACALKLSAAPSLEPATGKGQTAIPDKLSEHRYVIVTSVLFQPAALAGGATLALISGGVLSRFTRAVAVADLPAWSVTVPEMLCPLPSALTRTGAGQLTMSEALGTQLKLTVTSVLFHPPAFGNGVSSVVMRGAANSIFRRTTEFAVLPAWSVTLAVYCCALPSVPATCGWGHACTPERLSEHAYVIVTGVVFHPAALGCGAATEVMTGGVVPIYKVTGICTVLPAWSVAMPTTTWFEPSLLT